MAKSSLTFTASLQIVTSIYIIIRASLKKSIIFSQTLRLKRICYQKSDLFSHVKEPKNWFRKRGYPVKVISEQVNRESES